MQAAMQKREKGAYLNDSEKALFQQNFQKACFKITHNLKDHPLFKTDALLAQALGQPESVYFDAGEIRIDQRWEGAHPRAMTVEDAIHNISNAKAWVLLKNAERNPEYARLVDKCLAEAEELTGQPFLKTMRNRELIIFLTSPNRVTPYHIDRECNFLLQIEGSKTVYTFDGRDRTILTEEELERFWTVDTNAARYKPTHQAKAKPFVLGPGEGLHIPVNFPHWVQNGNNVSVSVSINFQFPDSQRADVYRANFHLRQKGLTPTPPGKSPLRDSLKAAAYGPAKKLLGLPGK